MGTSLLRPFIGQQQGKLQGQEIVRQREAQDQAAQVAAQDRQAKMQMQALERMLLERDLNTPPKPTAPVFGTPEWAKAYETQQQIEARYRPKPVTPSVTPDRRFNVEVEDKIVNDFQTQTRDLQLAAQAFGVIEGARNGTNPAQPVALLYAYARLLDPGSVVREGELAILTRIGSVDQRIKKAMEHAAKGTLPQEIIDHIYKQSRDILEQRQLSFEEYRNQNIQRGQRHGIDVAPVLPNPYERFNQPPQGGATGNINLQLPPLRQDQIERAQSDPQFKAFLIQKGYKL